jgi:hypothetical protein
LRRVAGSSQHQLSRQQSQQQQGEPFMVAVAAVPMQFFQEGFFDGW